MLGSQIDAYRRQEIAAASPGQLVRIAFEQGVVACRRQDRRRASRIVHELAAALDPAQPQIAGRLLVLYDWVLRLLREGRFPEAERILDELRVTWTQVLAAQCARGAPSRSAASGTHRESA